MAGPIELSRVVQSAVRVSQRAATQEPLPLAVERGAQSALNFAPTTQPRLVIVGIGRTPPKTTASLVEHAVAKGLTPGDDVIVTRYADLRVGKDRGFVRLAGGTGSDGLVLAGKGQQSLFLFRGGGNLKDHHLRKIGMIQSVDGAQSLTDLGFIERAGSKAITHERLSEAGLALATTLPVRGEAAAIKAFDEIISEHGGGVAVLKKVNSLGGKDVHFVSSHDEIRSVIAADKNSDYVMQEFLPHAKDQDIRVHMVYDRGAGTFKVENAYTRNRNSFQLTPNLANGGFPTNYILSPWEEKQAIQAARVLAQGSPTAPLHVGLDLFPRMPITASRVEQNYALQQAVREGKMSLDDAIKADQHSAVIGEAASSAGTKGTELVLGEGTNPVVDAMVREITRARKSGVAPLTDAETAARMIRGG